METKLKCPFCKSERFLRTTKDEVEMIDDGNSIRDDIIGSDWSVEYKYTCINCDKDLTDVELVKE